jgi:hypothetical protein
MPLEEYEQEESLEKNRISNISTVHSNIGYIATLGLNLTLLLPTKSASNPLVDNYVLVLVNSYWVITGIWWCTYSTPPEHEVDTNEDLQSSSSSRAPARSSHRASATPLSVGSKSVSRSGSGANYRTRSSTLSRSSSSPTGSTRRARSSRSARTTSSSSRSCTTRTSASLRRSHRLRRRSGSGTSRNTGRSPRNACSWSRTSSRSSSRSGA